jgi:phosphatidylinositol dimannoside acyltransferase
MYEWIGRLSRLGPAGGARNGMAGILPRLPAAPLVRAGGWVLYHLLGKSRRTVAANMVSLLTDKGRTDTQNKAAIRTLTKAYFEHAASTLYELLLEAGSLPETGAHKISIDGEEHLSQALRDGKGAILYAPHMGNFFYSYWKLSRKYRCLTVATASCEELRPFYLQFERLGCKGLDYDATPPLELIRQLKRHLLNGGIVYLLGDFYRPSFPQSRLFGRVTRGPAGAALLALELGSPVIPCYGFREDGGRHRLVLEEPVRLQEHYSRKQRPEAMEHLNAGMERQIRSKPEQWFYWFDVHKRWYEGGE